MQGISVINVPLFARYLNYEILAVIRNHVLEIGCFGEQKGFYQKDDVDYDDCDTIPEVKQQRDGQQKGKKKQEHDGNHHEGKSDLVQKVPAESHEKFLLKNMYRGIIPHVM